MSHSICGVDCGKCTQKGICQGCVASNGRPFHGDCVIALCCQNKGHEHCDKCSDIPCGLKERLIAEFNALGMKDMGEVTELNAINGFYINLEYTLPSGQFVKMWDDKKIYLGNQIEIKGTTKYYGLAADEKYLMVSEYGKAGRDAKIVLFKRWNETSSPDSLS